MGQDCQSKIRLRPFKSLEVALPNQSYPGDAEPDPTCPDIVAIYESDVTYSNCIIPYGLVAGKIWLADTLNLQQSN